MGLDFECVILASRGVPRRILFYSLLALYMEMYSNGILWDAGAHTSYCSHGMQILCLREMALKDMLQRGYRVAGLT